jgi:hypothetical protein
MGRVSTKGTCAGLFSGSSAHIIGSAMPVWAYDFHDVNIVGPKTPAAPAAAPILSISLRVTPELSFLVFLRFLAI